MLPNHENTYMSITDENIHQVMELWISDKENCIKVFGYISHWNVSGVTDMSFYFMT